MNLRKISALAVFVSLTLSGCASEPLGLLNDTDWLLQTLNGEPVESTFPPITLNFGTNGRVLGDAGCNNYMGDYTYTASENKITFGSILRTAKLCTPEEIMEQEAKFVTGLRTAVTYQIEDDQLELYTADGTLVISLAQD